MAVPTTGVDSPAPPPPDSGPSTRRERVGWYFYDWANSAFSTTVISVFLGPYLTHIAETAAACPPAPKDDPTYQCLNPVFHVGGLNVLPGSIFPYAVSLSVLLQVVVLPVTGAIADRSSHKKQLLALFAYIGSGATIGLVFLTGSRWLLGAGLFILANIAFGASIVVYNSFLTQLAGPDDRDAVSSLGWAIGYIGGGLLLLFNLVAIIIGGDDADTAAIARWSIVSAGVWWAAFTTLPLITLRNRPAVAGEETGNVLTGGFRQLGQTLRHLMAYPLTLYLPHRVPDLQRRHPDGHHARRHLRQPGAEADPEHADPDHPAGAVPRLRRRAAAGAAGPHVRRLEDGARQPGDVAGRGGHRLLPAGPQAAAVHGARPAARHRARRQPGAVAGRCSAS